MASEPPPSYNPECNNVTEGGISNNDTVYASEGQIKTTTPNDNVTYTSVPLDIAPPDYVPPDNNDEINEPLTPKANENSNSSNTDNASRWKNRLIFGGCCWAIAIVLFCIGGTSLNDNLEFKKVAQKTTCTIQSYTQKECSYDCNCHKDSDGHERCSTCYGLEYEYFVTSDLCDGSTLHQQDWDSNGACPQRLKPVGHSQKCWVHCEELEYSWASPGGLIAVSIVLLVFGVCCWCCGCVSGNFGSNVR